MSEHPAPLTPAEADLTGYAFMPLFGAQLFGSDFNLEATDAEFRIALRLWWTAWTQVPAASLPADEIKLCQLAGFPRDGMAKWRKVRDLVMRNFVLCSDGRYYHRMLAPHAIAAWEERKAAIARGKASGIARRLKGGLPPETNSKRSREQLETLSTPSQDDLDSKSNKGEREGETTTTAFPVVMTSRPEPPKAVPEENPTPNPTTDARLTKLSAMLARTKATDVDRSQALLKRYLAKATDSQLERAVSDACKSSKGEPFGVAYLDPIVERIVAEDAKAREAAERRVAKTHDLIAEQRAVVPSPKPDGIPDAAWLRRQSAG